ncbi:tetratricopeptide repeat protein [Streptomyces sp. NPDC099088]|uniref:tetratricopeptide repeat protein n=1 Tax=Streptomyces sp. NPDC099088 TaxID=3366101 RepID=UPI003825914A
MAEEGSFASNVISGGIFFQQVVQGRDITVILPPTITPALSGLPAPSSTFTGRDVDVEELLLRLAPNQERHQAVLVAQRPLRTAVAGLAGVGKTELVVQVATRALQEPDWFPGGVLFIDMFGYDPERRLSPERALEGFLRALGLPAEQLPLGLQDLQRLYRSVLAAFVEQGRRMLVIIDNASSAEQAAPLLPADGTTAAVITSRHTLDIDARLHDVQVLDGEASVALLEQALLQARGLDDTRVQDDPEAAASVAKLCAGLPLALRIAAALLADTPGRPLASLAKALQSEHSRLDRLRREDRAVRAAFDLSYHHLAEAAARIFRLLAVNPGPDVSTESAAALGELDAFTVEETLQDLNRAHLIEASGAVWGRWRMHDLIRLYAEGHSRAATHHVERSEGTGRLYAHYLATAQEAGTHVEFRRRSQPTPSFVDRAAALEWLGSERQNLVAAAVGALEAGQPLSGIGLALSVDSYLHRCRAFPDAVVVHEASLRAAVHLGDLKGTAISHNNLGIAYNEADRNEEAVAAFIRAEQLLAELGDDAERGRVLNGLGSVLRETGHPVEACQMLQQALTIQQMLGDLAEQAAVLNNLSLARLDISDHAEALETAADATALFDRLGDEEKRGKALCTMALALDSLGRPLEAAQACDQALDAYRAADLSHEVGVALMTKATILALSLSQCEVAAACLSQAETIFEQTRDGSLRVRALTFLGMVRASQYDLARATAALKEAIRIATGLGLVEELNQARESLDIIEAS